ncbi:hypothetical protein [Desulforamulus ruminis]|uniref:4Fe-4S ferredoxin iron-sulfur-binding domain-containing protein n=1 Tax=Desulforamulus ruminis (strain ATCC 23193 / DSM 2154 / NCIMB 8452 / DL) TaxID=696281 RepID=F6DP23_DESRL|nr:hypothetical protein [Desulforamulus ruminis]AEG60742.1 4Fe-4S ferredoxin iron-sulfur-binding domain-containing protein [Desulforamulus ruminis DSM 2154]
MSVKDNWMKWRRELMDSCGQCVGFRAKGLELPAAGEGHVCTPNEACPKHCPGFQMNFDEIAEELAAVGKREPASVVKEEVPAKEVQEDLIAACCSHCGRSENDGFLIRCKHKGETRWVCTKCLPSLIHG